MWEKAGHPWHAFVDRNNLGSWCHDRAGSPACQTLLYAINIGDRCIEGKTMKFCNEKRVFYPEGLVIIVEDDEGQQSSHA